MASMPLGEWSRAANSSPPIRATAESWSEVSRNRLAMIWRYSSPAWCPSVSLMSLNRSRSRMKRATLRPSVSADFSSWTSMKRLGGPVR